MRIPCQRNPENIRKIVTYYRGASTSGFLVNYMDWVNSIYESVGEWRQCYASPYEQYCTFDEGWLKLCLDNYVEIPSSNLSEIRNYMAVNTYRICGAANTSIRAFTPFLFEQSLEESDEPNIKDLLECLNNEKRIEFDKSIDTALINKSAVFQKCLALALKVNFVELVSDKHNYQESYQTRKIKNYASSF